MTNNNIANQEQVINHNPYPDNFNLPMLNEQEMLPDVPSIFTRYNPLQIIRRNYIHANSEQAYLTRAHNRIENYQGYNSPPSNSPDTPNLEVLLPNNSEEILGNAGNVPLSFFQQLLGLFPNSILVNIGHTIFLGISLAGSSYILYKFYLNFRSYYQVSLDKRILIPKRLFGLFLIKPRFLLFKKFLDFFKSA